MKQAYAMVESIKRWRHFLLGKVFKVITDQKSVSLMFNNDKLSKIKNEKVIRWRIELSCFQFEVVHRPGKENLVADTLSRDICCSLTTGSQLVELHGSLCHPGVSRMAHFVRSRNLPYSIEDIRKVTSSCSICAKRNRNTLNLIKRNWLNRPSPSKDWILILKGLYQQFLKIGLSWQSSTSIPVFRLLLLALIWPLGQLLNAWFLLYLECQTIFILTEGHHSCLMNSKNF